MPSNRRASIPTLHDRIESPARLRPPRRHARHAPAPKRSCLRGGVGGICRVLVTITAFFGFGLTTCSSFKPGLEDTVAGITLRQLEIQIIEDFPLNVLAVVRGTSACSAAPAFTQSRDGNSFELALDVEALAAAPDNCDNAAAEFEAVVPLQVDGLRAGEYQVKLYRLSESFDLPADNIIRW